MSSSLAAWFAGALLASCAHATGTATVAPPTIDEVRAVSPALARYTTELVRGALWQQAELAPRDRSLVTLAALIARGDAIELPLYLDRALEHGVTPAEISEVITHLAFYAGWSHAMSAVAVTRRVFAQRHVRPEQLPAASSPLLPMDEVAEAQRADRVQQSFGSLAPGLVRYTTDVLFRELWLRPALTPRDRSLVTVCALIATGNSAQLTYHLNRAMDYGLTSRQVAGAVTQLAFVGGWPGVFSSLTVVKDVIDKHPHP
jgi:4-carboxymuconolactone decarboxylase